MRDRLTQETELGSELSKRLVHLVGFKWLMAGMGWWIDLPRFERDPCYASVCIERGLSAGSTLMRERTVELLPFLGRATPELNSSCA